VTTFDGEGLPLPPFSLFVPFSLFAQNICPCLISIVCLQVAGILLECTAPIEAKFARKFAQLATDEPDGFASLQKIKNFNSAGDDPLTQRLMVEDKKGHAAPQEMKKLLKKMPSLSKMPSLLMLTSANNKPLNWWSMVVKEVGPNFHTTDKINRRHKGFKQMITETARLQLKFQDVFLKGVDSCDGTWEGIKDDKDYAFVFLCFMHAYGKKLVNDTFQDTMAALFPDAEMRHQGPYKTLQRCHEKLGSLPFLEHSSEFAFMKLPPCAGLLDLCRVTLVFKTVEELLEGHSRILADQNLDIESSGRVKNGYLESFAAPGGYRDLKINPVLRGTGHVCEVKKHASPPLPIALLDCRSESPQNFFFSFHKIQLTLKSFSEIKVESHPYYNLWRILSEYTTESFHGKRGALTLQDGINHFEGAPPREGLVLRYQ
jgi:hypothetical protein